MAKIKLDEPAGVLGASKKALDSEWNRLKAIGDGKISGQPSPLITKKMLSTVDSNEQKVDGQAGNEQLKHNIGAMALASYTTAAARDANYAILGRKAMRVLALQGRTRAVYGRMHGAIEAEGAMED